MRNELLPAGLSRPACVIDWLRGEVAKDSVASDAKRLADNRKVDSKTVLGRRNSEHRSSLNDYGLA